MSDLIEKIDTILKRKGAFEPPVYWTKILRECRAAIKELTAPVLPDDVVEMTQYLRVLGLFNTDTVGHREAAADLLERQAREIRKLKRRPSVATFNALQEECDGRMVAIKKLQQRIEQLEARLAVVDCKHEWVAVCGPNGEGIKTCRKCNYQPKPPAS